MRLREKWSDYFALSLVIGSQPVAMMTLKDRPTGMDYAKSLWTDKT
jgi:hypothetical protein